MDPTILGIAIGGTLLFFGLIAYKALWFIRKVNEDPASEHAENQADDRPATNNPASQLGDKQAADPD